MKTRSLTGILLLTVAACAVTTGNGEVSGSEPRGTEPSNQVVLPAPKPLARSGSAYELAAEPKLPVAEPETHPGLHNVYRLSGNVVSGGEPENRAAFEALSVMGIRTILSVDGKTPDAALAAEFGLRYVHIPIRYNGIEHDEVLAMAKTFRELEGPFFVHCYHGVHRGPAAAAIGRMILDGTTREEAVAEMRQWCGTSGKYEGLYATVAFDELPSAEESEAFAFDFPAEHRFSGLRQAMVDISRSWDTIESLSEHDWQPSPDHPDASARNEARKMARGFSQSLDSESDPDTPADFLGWLRQSKTDAERLAELLDAHSRGDADAGGRARELATTMKATCTACHTEYRN